ncbi:MAG TPA: GyrI-like domain-containing protein [Stellaceae bacterium]|nr:GyrI-like domain-containing protein [Stellaceae bacterium]
MKPSTGNDYKTRIERVLAHVAGHLDAELSLAGLAEIAHVSPYHFHRLFRAMTGESVAALVRRLRLEAAAKALRETEAAVIDIALAAGYGSPEAFARAFHAAFGLAPTEFRRVLIAPRYTPPLSLELRLDRPRMRLQLEPLAGGTELPVTIEIFPDRLAACLRHVGPYDDVPRNFERLYRWAASKRLLAEGALVMGLSYDNPELVDAEELRYDAAVALPAPRPLPEDFRLETVRGGRYAVHLLRGPYSGIRETFRRIFAKWLPTSGEEIDDRPCLELYLNDPLRVSESELLTQICVPLRPKEDQC